MEDRFPLPFQIACLILFALFIWAFSIAREPRGWRRLFQSIFSKSEMFSVNRNKVIDETLKRYGIVIAMIFLVAFVVLFVIGITAPARARLKNISKEEWHTIEEVQRAQGNSSGTRRAILP